MTPTSHTPVPEEPDEGDVVAYLANSLSDLRDQLDRAQSTTVTALVIARLALQRRNDDGEEGGKG